MRYLSDAQMFSNVHDFDTFVQLLSLLYAVPRPASDSAVINITRLPARLLTIPIRKPTPVYPIFHRYSSFMSHSPDLSQFYLWFPQLGFGKLATQITHIIGQVSDKCPRRSNYFQALSLSTVINCSAHPARAEYWGVQVLSCNCRYFLSVVLRQIVLGTF
jgi:hypothetical protein